MTIEKLIEELRKLISQGSIKSTALIEIRIESLYPLYPTIKNIEIASPNLLIFYGG